MSEIEIQKEATTLYKRFGYSSIVDFDTFLKAYILFVKDNPNSVRKSAVAFNGFLGKMLGDPKLEDQLYNHIILKRREEGKLEKIIEDMLDSEITEISKV